LTLTLTLALALTALSDTDTVFPLRQLAIVDFPSRVRISPLRRQREENELSAEVSGKAFLGLIRSIKNEHGDDALRAAIDGAGAVARDVFGARIRIMGWYPYPAYAAFLRSIERVAGTGDGASCRRMGAMGGARDLGTIFRVFSVLASPERLIRGCDHVWPSYYRGAGRMESIEWAPERTVLRIHDFREMEPLHCRLMEGWMISTMKQIGALVAEDARETVCASRGGPYHEFTCSWRRE
jgi:hypothetical protein